MHRLSGPLVDSLQAQLYPYGLDPVQIRQHFHNPFREAVWPGSDRQGGDFRAAYGFHVECLQPFRLSVGIGKGLKISDIFSLGQRDPGREFAIDPCAGVPDLLFDRQQRRREFPRSALRAECTSADTYGSVAVGAGAAARKRKLIYLCSKTLPERL